MLVINPDECIDCGVCEPECPIEAIIPDSDPRADKWIDVNRDYADQWPNLTRKIAELPTAEAMKGQAGKYESHFSPKPGEGD